MPIYQRAAVKRLSKTTEALILVVILIVGAGLFWVLPSYFEARAYRNVTGRDVSTWDALWLDLRVQEQVKP